MLTKSFLITIVLIMHMCINAMAPESAVYDQHGPLRVVTSDGKKHKLSLDELKSLESVLLHNMVSFRLAQAAQLGVDPHVLADDPTANPYLTARALKLLRKLAQNKTRADKTLAKRKVGILAELAVAAENLQIDWLKPAAYEGFAKRMIKVSDKTFSDFVWVLERVIAGSNEEERIKDRLSEKPVSLFDPEYLYPRRWSPDSKYLVGCFCERPHVDLVLLNVLDKKVEWRISLPDGHVVDYSFGWSPDGINIAFCHNGTFYVYSVAGKFRQKIPDHGEITWSYDGAYAVIYNNAVYLYDASVMNWRVLDCHVDAASEGHVAWSPDGSLIAITKKFGGTWIFDRTGNKLYGSLMADGFVTWSSDSQRFFVKKCCPETLSCYEAHTCKLLYGTGSIYVPSYSPDKKYLFAIHAGYADKKDWCELIELDTGKVKCHLMPWLGMAGSYGSFSPDSAMFAIIGVNPNSHTKNKTVSIFSAPEGSTVASFCVGGFLGSDAWSNDSQYLAVYSDKQIGIWSRKTGCVQYPYTGKIARVKWLADNKHLMLETQIGVRCALYVYNVVTQCIKKAAFDGYDLLSSFSPNSRYVVAKDHIYINPFMLNLPELVKELRSQKGKKAPVSDSPHSSPEDALEKLFDISPTAAISAASAGVTPPPLASSSSDAHDDKTPSGV